MLVEIVLLFAPIFFILVSFKLKNLCHAENVVFLQKEILIMSLAFRIYCSGLQGYILVLKAMLLYAQGLKCSGKGFREGHMLNTD